MENRKCFYLVEGECEEKLLKALKVQPALINPGIVKKFNVIQKVIPVSRLMSFDPGSREDINLIFPNFGIRNRLRPFPLLDNRHMR